MGAALDRRKSGDGGAAEDDQRHPEPSRVGAPPSLDLPFFAYGFLKPGELAYEQIEAHVGSSVEAATSAELHVIDGMPILRANARGLVRGYLLDLDPEGFDAVGAFEPSTHYQWTEVVLGEPEGARAWALTAAESGSLRIPTDGSAFVDHWTAATDPVFAYGLPSARRLVTLGPFSARMGKAEWLRFYQLQAGYLLLCSVLEHLATLVLGHGGPTNKVMQFGKRVDIKRAYASQPATVPRRSVGATDTLQRTTPRPSGSDFVRAAYQVRSNIAHRGKGANSEATLVQQYFVALHNTLRVYLLSKLPELAAAWTELEGDQTEGRWCIDPAELARRDATA